MRLTDVGIRTLPPPEKGQRTYTDDALQGFGVRVSQGGTKTFVVVAGAMRERTTIGRYPTLSLSEARAEAKRILAERTLGKHRPKTITFDELREEFLTEAKRRNRASTFRDYTRLLKRFPFGRTHLQDITRTDIRKRLDKMAETPSEQRHALVAVKTVFRHAVREGYIDSSPCDALRAPQTNRARDRALSDAELQEVLQAAQNEPYPFGAIVQLLILTGQRRGEIASLQWDWIGGDAITLPDWICKNHRAHTFPIGTMAQAVIAKLPGLHDVYLFPARRTHVRGKDTTVFNGWGRPKERLDGKLKDVAPYTLHDFRRTLSTKMAELGVPQVVVEKLLNHVSGGSQSPISQVYNRHSYLPEMRDAVARYEAHLSALLAG